jgi:hypothetical protein
VTLAVGGQRNHLAAMTSRSIKRKPTIRMGATLRRSPGTVEPSRSAAPPVRRRASAAAELREMIAEVNRGLDEANQRLDALLAR